MFRLSAIASRKVGQPQHETVTLEGGDSSDKYSLKGGLRARPSAMGWPLPPALQSLKVVVDHSLRQNQFVVAKEISKRNFLRNIQESMETKKES